MNKMQTKNLNRRARVYLAILLLGIIAVPVRIALVQADRGRSIISFVSEWAKYGKPVIARKIQAVDTPVYTKFTVIRGSDRTASGFVTADIKDKIKEGQDVFAEDGGAPCGKILNIGKDLDINTGMFPVEVEFDESSNISGLITVIFAQTQTLPKVLVMPNSVLDIYHGNYYLWKIENGKAKRTQVRIGLRNGYGTVIQEGINSGDMIVFIGQKALKENDRVNILDEGKTK